MESLFFIQNPLPVHSVSFILLTYLKVFTKILSKDSGLADTEGFALRENILGVVSGW